MFRILYIDVDDLKLCKVSILVSRSFKETISKLDFDDEQSLFPMDELSGVFSESPDSRHLHIAVRVPPAGECGWLSALWVFTALAVIHPNLPSEPVLDLNCWVLGDDSTAHFFRQNCKIRDGWWLEERDQRQE